MKPFISKLRGSVLRGALGILVFFLTVSSLPGEPFLPANDSVVLEQLRTVPLDEGTRQIRRLREELSRSPTNLPLAVLLSKRLIQKSRTAADPRYLSYAQATLAPWWTSAAPPAEVLVLRATIRQSNHDFTSALVDLDQVLKTDPSNAQAWLTKATICQVLGRYDEARASAVPLQRLTSPLIAVTCSASAASLNGHAAASYQALQSTLQSANGANDSERLWALTVLAEMAARLGRTAEAEANFQQALALPEPDAYLFTAYADFLLDQNRAGEVPKLLEKQSPSDGVLVRLARAEKLRNGSKLKFYVDSLRDRFEASARRGESIHQREEAMYHLYLLDQPASALRLARENWACQREPMDARVFLEASLAAGDLDAAKAVLSFLETNRVEDVQLQMLAAKARETSTGKSHGP